jgi:hypothetical protein
MFSQLKPVAYNNVDIAPIPFNELLALAQFQRQDQMATEQRIDAYTQFVATNPTFGAATAIAQQKMADLQGVIANTDFKNPTSGANLRRSVSSFMTDRFWVQNKAAYTNYQQSQQAMNHLAQQGMLNEADRLAFEAYANGDPKAKQALHDMYIASGSTPEDARAMAGKSWDGQSDFNYQFVKYNVAELKDAAESAVKAITPVLIKHVDADGIESDRKVIYKDQLDSANSQFRASIDANQTADRAWREYLVKGGSYTKDPKTGRTVLKTPAELQRDKAQFFSGMFEAASPDLQLDQVDVNGRSYATLEEKTNTTSLEKWKLAEHDKRDLLKRE